MHSHATDGLNIYNSGPYIKEMIDVTSQVSFSRKIHVEINIKALHDYNSSGSVTW